MLGLPRSTEVNRRIAKDRLYENTTLTPQTSEMIKEQIEAVFWRNKLAESTISVATGETVKEFQVFEVELRRKGIDRRILPAIAKAIPYTVLFVLTFDDEAQAWMEVSGTFYNTDWLPLTELTLKFEGLNLNTVFENLARQIAAGRLDTENDIAEAVDLDKRRQKLKREIAVLEKKVLKEKQFNKQVALNSELKRLRKELEGIG